MNARLLLGILIASLCAPIAAQAQEKVTFAWRPGLVSQFNDSDSAGVLSGSLFKPAAVRAPFVVFMHGCGGFQPERVSHWGRFFAQRGVGVLMVDSFASRGMTNACENPALELIKRRADDAGSALAWLTMQPFVRRDRIAVMGQSQGGTALLFALNEGVSTANGFAAGLALYPACIRAVKNNIRLAKPVLVLIGSEDTATPAAHCAILQASQPDQGRLDLVVYPGAAHEFDNPVKPYLLLGKYKGGEHAPSRAAAQDRVAQWIETDLKQ